MKNMMKWNWREGLDWLCKSRVVLLAIPPRMWVLFFALFFFSVEFVGVEVTSMELLEWNCFDGICFDGIEEELPRLTCFDGIASIDFFQWNCFD